MHSPADHGTFEPSRRSRLAFGLGLGLCLGGSLSGIACSSSESGDAATGGIAAGGAAAGSSAQGGSLQGGMSTGGTSTGGAATGGAATGGAATGGTGTGGTGTGGTGADVPADQTQAGIEAFLKTDVFAGWTWDSATPREATTGSPHGRVRVGINATLVQSIAAGDDGSNEKPFAQGSMALKELYDSSDMLVGRAFMLKRGAGNPTTNWVYYCDGTVDRCGLNSGTQVPYYATDNTFSGCNVCHSTYFFIGTE